jgi:DNA-binding IclR family transcriptional regulator
MNTVSEIGTPGSSVKSADRCRDLLELFAATTSDLTLSQVCAETTWPKSSALALLRTLLRRGYLIDAPSGNGYRLGPGVAALGSAYLQRIDLVAVAQEVVRWVAHECDETVHLAVLRGTNVLYIAKEEGSGQMRMVSAVGKMIPAHGTGVGKVLLSALSPGEFDRLFPPGHDLPRLTEHTVTDRDALRRMLAEVRARGYAMDDGESTAGLRCIAGPVRDVTGQVVAAMSVSVPNVRFTPERQPVFRRVLLEGARRVSLRIGCPAALWDAGFRPAGCEDEGYGQ